VSLQAHEYGNNDYVGGGGGGGGINVVRGSG